MDTQENEVKEMSGKLQKLTIHILKKYHAQKSIFAVGCIIVLVLIGVFSVLKISSKKDNNMQVISVATLEKIIGISKLSTYTSVYNGVAEIKNTDKPDKTDYYVSYEATIEAGIDFDEIKVEIDNEEKAISVILPKAYITEVNVDIASLDFIFYNNKVNDATISQAAYKECVKDATEESHKQESILELAQKSAVNTVTALTKPLIEQVDNQYQLVVK